jgi:RNA polymerase sigma-70 factor (ECF subfamily)
MPEAPDPVAAIRARDPEAMESIIRECLPGLLRAAVAAGLSRDRAEDAVQASLLVFVERASSYDGRARVCSWIHGILYRKILEEHRTARRSAREEHIEEVVESRFDARGSWTRPPRGPGDELARGELRRQLEACLGDLPDRQRLAFALREVEGMTTAEVCKIMEVSANNLGVLLFRARNGLRECLEAKGFEGSSDAEL